MLRHRLVLTPSAEVGGTRAGDVIGALLRASKYRRSLEDVRARVRHLLPCLIACACIDEPNYEGRLCNAFTPCPAGFACGLDDRCRRDAIPAFDAGPPDAMPPRPDGSDAGAIDTEPVDAEPTDAGPLDADARVPMTFEPSTFGVTSGGGAAASPAYRARVVIGAPALMGVAESPSYRVRIGER